jgi:hypothetical protein
MSDHEITFNTDFSQSIRTQADFTHNITPTVISITDTGFGKFSVTEDIEAVLRKIEHWHQGSIAKFKIMCRDGKGFWHRVRRDGKTVSLLALQQTDSARSLQEVVYQRELIGREVRPIQKRKLCSLHDRSIVDLAHSPGEYCDRCVGDRVHK